MFCQGSREIGRQVISSKELESFFRAEGLKWRDRVLTPARTIQLMLLQVLHGNTAINHLRHLSDLNFTAGALLPGEAKIAARGFGEAPAAGNFKTRK